ncbi:cytochrome P450 [Streptomyces spectabilis]|uniref:Cytochrome P450 n=1 Tax=Streptomyces spectabilis TaxID=68270 RepID=A0A5P2X5H7_STRST|nr:cytochrome P450 [Streptomyces spectabilis]MBB5101008.1 cytochrome P450 [Streptomyces spectabilis]MCI3900220.1 cytochrome P450 [Streptomyces spectabilis]QEV57826.1 cytochrome P450 [Streptomyces spectabilis]GGV08949.1 cytochrome P450 hydroxylase [Streptomyces spectabilis]
MTNIAESTQQRFGEMSALFADPYPLYRHLRDEEPVKFSPELNAWVVSRYNDIKAVCGDPETFSSRGLTHPFDDPHPAVAEVLATGYPMVPIAISTDGEAHARFRHPYVQAMAQTRTKEFSSAVDCVVDRHLDRIVPLGKCDVIADLARPVTVEVILRFMGISAEHIEDASRWSRDLVSFLFAPAELDERLRQARNLVAFQHFIADEIEERRARPTSDVISVMVHEQLPDAEPLSMNEIVSALCGLVMAGHKTTIDTVGNGLAVLLAEPARWAQLCADPSTIETVVEEILRYDAPLQGLWRTTTRDTTLSGVSIPAGCRLFILFGSGNRDAEAFDSPDQVRIDRMPNRHLSFGHGAHFCIGAPLARAEVQKLLARLAERLPNLSLSPEFTGERHTPVLGFHGYTQLPVEW